MPAFRFPRCARSALVVSALLLPARAEVDLTKLPPPASRPGVTYAADIRPIFAMNCFRCHGSDRQMEGIRLDSLEATLKGGEHGKVIVPGASVKSPLVVSVARLDPKDAMPPIRKAAAGGPPPANHPAARALTPAEVGLIRAWIDQGAR